jgi:hypothetical protein
LARRRLPEPRSITRSCSASSASPQKSPVNRPQSPPGSAQRSRSSPHSSVTSTSPAWRRPTTPSIGAHAHTLQTST